MKSFAIAMLLAATSALETKHYTPEYQEYGYGDMLVNTEQYGADAPKGYDYLQRRSQMRHGRHHHKAHSKHAHRQQRSHHSHHQAARHTTGAPHSRAQLKGEFEYGIVRSKLVPHATPLETYTNMENHSNEEQWKADAPKGYAVEPLDLDASPDDAAKLQIRAYPGIRPIGRSTVGADGTREDEIDNFKVMVGENSDDEQWVADAPHHYMQGMNLDATQVQTKDEEESDNENSPKNMLMQRNAMSDVSSYVADAPKDYPAVASDSWEHDDQEDVQLNGIGLTVHGTGSYIGQKPEEPDDVDAIKESQGQHANDEDYVSDAPKLNPEVLQYDAAKF